MNSENLSLEGCASGNLHAADCICDSKIDLDYQLEAQLNVTGCLSQMLNIIVSPDIEALMVCPLFCCLLKDAINYIDILIDSGVAENQSIIGDAEQVMLRNLKENLWNFRDYDTEKGFSKTDRWLDLVGIANKVNSHLFLIVSLFHRKDITHSNGMGMVKRHYDTFNYLCDMLAVVVSPTVEEDIEEEVCPLEVCCVGNHKILPYFKQIIIQLDFLFFTERYVNEKQSILGEQELIVLRWLYTILKNVHSYNDKKGFSKKQSWLDLVDVVNSVNAVLKEVAKRHAEKNNR